jgi:hypothetical protein
MYTRTFPNLVAGDKRCCEVVHRVVENANAKNTGGRRMPVESGGKRSTFEWTLNNSTAWYNGCNKMVQCNPVLFSFHREQEIEGNNANDFGYMHVEIRYFRLVVLSLAAGQPLLGSPHKSC